MGETPGSLLPGRRVPPVTLGMTNIKGMAIGHSFSCFLDSAGRVKCVGSNENGQCGQNATLGTAVGDFYSIGDALPYVSIHPGAVVKQIAAGWEHACALLTTGKVKCWGQGGSGQLGLGLDWARPVGLAPGDMGSALPFLDFGPGFVPATLSLGSSHSCAVSTTNAVRCWGGNWVAQLGLGSNSDFFGPPTNASTVNFGAGVRQLVAMSGNTCALLVTGGVKCYGWAQFGVPGQGDYTNHWGDVVAELGTGLPYVTLA